MRFTPWQAHRCFCFPVHQATLVAQDPLNRSLESGWEDLLLALSLALARVRFLSAIHQRCSNSNQSPPSCLRQRSQLNSQRCHGRLSKPRSAKAGASANLTFAGVASVAIVVMALTIRAEDGLPARAPSPGEELSSLEVMWHWDCPQKINAPNSPPGRFVWSELDGRLPEPEEFSGATATQSTWRPCSIRPRESGGLSLLVWRSCPAFIDNKHAKRSYSDQPNYFRRLRSRASLDARLATQASRRQHDCSRIRVDQSYPGWSMWIRKARGPRSAAYQYLAENCRMRALISEIDPRTHQILPDRPSTGAQQCTLSLRPGTDAAANCFAVRIHLARSAPTGWTPARHPKSFDQQTRCSRARQTNPHNSRRTSID